MEKLTLEFRDKQVQSIVERGESKFIQLSLNPGQGVPRHHTPRALTVVMLTGRVLFTVGEEDVILRAPEMLVVPPAAQHAVEAIEQSTVLLVLTPET